MNVLSEIKNILAKSESCSNDYQLYVFENKVFKVSNKDLDRLKDLVIELNNEKLKGVNENFDDFYYHPEVSSAKSDEHDYAEAEMLDEIKKVIASLNLSENKENKLDNNTYKMPEEFNINDRLEVKNVVNLGESLIKWINIDEERKQNMKRFLNVPILSNQGNNKTDNLIKSQIGTVGNFAEGSELHDYLNSTSVEMLESPKSFEIVGAEYAFNNDTVKFVGFSKNEIEHARSEEQYFLNNHGDAELVNYYVRNGNAVGFIGANCLVLDNEKKKGV